MLVAINKCWGGFSLSREAWIMLRDLGHQEALEEPDIGGYWKDGSGPRTNIGSYESFCSNVDRNDPLLIQVIQKLGDKASGSMAKVVIVEIPDDVEWEIDDYDGRETVREVSRSWG